jgi:hypothetical protein
LSHKPGYFYVQTLYLSIWWLDNWYYLSAGALAILDDVNPFIVITDDRKCSEVHQKVGSLTLVGSLLSEWWIPRPPSSVEPVFELLVLYPIGLSRVLLSLSLSSPACQKLSHGNKALSDKITSLNFSLTLNIIPVNEYNHWMSSALLSFPCLQEFSYNFFLAFLMFLSGITSSNYLVSHKWKEKFSNWFFN